MEFGSGSEEESSSEEEDENAKKKVRYALPLNSRYRYMVVTVK